MTNAHPPANPLDRILWRLERTLKDRAQHPLRRLRQAIAEQRRKGTFDEDIIIKELTDIEMRSYVTGEDIDHLATKILRGAP
jgi:hypothetical protein